MPEVRTSVTPRKLVYPVLKHQNQRQVQKLKNLHRRITLTFLTRTIPGVMMAGVKMNGMMTGAPLDGIEVWRKLIHTEMF